MPMLERRRSPRFPFHTSGRVAVGQVEQNGIVLDLSANGVLFSTAQEAVDMLGERCELSLSIDVCSAAVIFKGIIVSQRRQLLGIEFSDVMGALRKVLEQIVEMNLGVPQLLNRDVPALLGQLHGDEVCETDTI